MANTGMDEMMRSTGTLECENMQNGDPTERHKPTRKDELYGMGVRKQAFKKGRLPGRSPSKVN